MVRLFLIKIFARFVRCFIDYKNVLRTRETLDWLAGLIELKVAGVTVSNQTINGIACEWIRPVKAEEGKVLLYFHGGGYAVGSIKTHSDLVSHIARSSNTVTLFVNYRLAPEYTYPAPIQDAVTVYNWLLSNGYTNRQIAFGGDSAGGGVVAGTINWLRDNGMPSPACAIMISPWLDMTLIGESITANRKKDLLLPAEALPIWRDNYMGETGTDAPYASTVLHSLHKLPPTLIQAGGDELLLSDAILYTEKAKAQGSTVALEIYPKMFHAFNAFWRMLPQAKEANYRLGTFIKAQLA
jgi:acetyl esterase/lipase